MSQAVSQYSQSTPQNSQTGPHALQTTPQISVVMPVFNAENTVSRAASSVLASGNDHFELIVVDDGSTDNSPAVLERLSSHYHRLCVLHVPHGGIVSALNTGIAAARGSLIARMDADDISLPHRLTAQQCFMDKHPEIGLVGGDIAYGGNRETTEGYARFVDWCNSIKSEGDIERSRFVESSFAHPSVMFRRDLIERFGGYREGDFPEDYELWLRWQDQGVRMAKVPDTVIIWNDPPQRLSRIDPRYRSEAFFSIKAGYLAQWLERNNPFHPEVFIWGAGRTTRKRVDKLLDTGIVVTAFVDIDPNKIGRNVHGICVVAPDQLPPPGKCFVLPYVAKRGAREDIAAWLVQHGYRPERDYIVAG